MAVGWSRDGAVQDQIDATVEDGVQLARSRLPDGESSTHCKECRVSGCILSITRLPLPHNCFFIASAAACSLSHRS